MKSGRLTNSEKARAVANYKVISIDGAGRLRVRNIN